MRKLKKLFIMGCAILLLNGGFSPRSEASIFGEENIILAKILWENIHQLMELRKILKNNKDTLDLLKDVNQGIKECLEILQTLNVHIDPGVFSDLRKLEEILYKIEDVYGKIPDTPAKEAQIVHDQSVAEAIQMHNDLYKYSSQLDQEGERIKERARVASPAGAQKLAAQSNGAILQALSQIQRNQAMLIKLTAEQVGMKNQEEKARSEQFKYQYESLGEAFGRIHFKEASQLRAVR